MANEKSVSPPTVLVVEDEALLRAVLVEGLASAGYAPLAAADGLQALALLETRRAPIDALVTDIDLGAGPSGWDVAAAFQATTPSAVVIYMTGASVGAWPRRSVTGGALMMKPFLPSDLERTLAAAFAARARFGAPA